MSEIDHRIHSPELAIHMAYAEKPYRELATSAFKLGLGLDDVLNAKAHESSLEVGRQYVADLTAMLDSIDIPKTEIQAEFDTYDMLVKYALESGYKQKHAGQAWRALVRFLDLEPRLHEEAGVISNNVRDISWSEALTIQFRITQNIIDEAAELPGSGVGKTFKELLSNYINSRVLLPPSSSE